MYARLSNHSDFRSEAVARFDESPYIVFRRVERRRNEPLLRHRIRILTYLHVREIEQPFGFQVLGILFEGGREFVNRALGSAKRGMNASAFQGEEAGILAMVPKAVFLFAETQISNRQRVANLFLEGGAECHAIVRAQLADAFELVNGVGGIPGL